MDQMPSSHPANNVKAQKGTERTDPWVRSYLILSSSITGLDERTLLPLCCRFWTELKWTSSERVVNYQLPVEFSSCGENGPLGELSVKLGQWDAADDIA